MIAGGIQAPVVAETEFPSLGAALNVKETKKDKKKKQTMSLGEFVGKTSSRPAPAEDESFLLNLPTAPRGRGDEKEDDGDKPLGGAFRGYGASLFTICVITMINFSYHHLPNHHHTTRSHSQNPPRITGGGASGGGDRFNRYGDGEGRPRRPPREDADQGPSRADLANDWGAERKFVPGAGSDSRYRDQDRGMGGGFSSYRSRDDKEFRGRGDRDRDLEPSRADTEDSWGANRRFVPSSPRDGGRGGGFRDRGHSGDREFKEASKADTESRWERHAEHKPTGFDDRPRRQLDADGGPPGSRKGFAEGWKAREGDGRRGGRDRFGDGAGDSRDASQERTWRRKEELDNGNATEDAEGETVRERPKLALKPRSVPLDKDEAGDEGRSSVFGAARPREQVLKEQGRDAVAEDLKLEQQRRGRKGRRESEGEIAELQKQIEEAKEKVENSEDKEAVEKEIAELEEQLRKLETESSSQEKKKGSSSSSGGGGGRSHGGGGRGHGGGGRGRENGKVGEEKSARW